jgi:hypothetical protein
MTPKEEAQRVIELFDDITIPFGSVGYGCNAHIVNRNMAAFTLVNEAIKYLSCNSENHQQIEYLELVKIEIIKSDEYLS